MGSDYGFRRPASIFVKSDSMLLPPQGLKNLQESATYKRTSENIQFAKVTFKLFIEVEFI